MQLSDLTVEDAKQIGKGSYGTVQLATHRKSGIRVAVKKIDKKSLTSAKMRETLRREI
jgi:serine/threonine protein kinase